VVSAAPRTLFFLSFPGFKFANMGGAVNINELHNIEEIRKTQQS
jgi:hypothetical protein